MKFRGSRLLLLVVSLFLLLGGADLIAADAFAGVPARQLLQDASGVKNSGGGDVVILLEERTYDIDAQNRVTETLHRQYRVDTQSGVENWASASAAWYPWYEDKPIIHARVVTADGIEHVLDEKSLTEGPVNENQPNIYDNGRVLRGPLPALAIGSVVEEEIVMKDHAPWFEAGVVRQAQLGSYWGPAEKTTITVRAPQTLPFKYVSRLLPNMSVEKKTTGDTVEYRFEQGHMDMLEDADPGLPSDVPRGPYVYFSTGASWAAIASAYDAVVEPKARLADVEELVKATVKPGDAREDKIRKLLYLLDKKVRYTGVEFDAATLVPAFPAETLKRGYGDCKDKALLLATMLNAAGIPAHLALLNSGNGQDLEPDYPGMYFDHAIVYVEGPPEMWIDATADSLRLGTIPDGDDGRLALIVDKSTGKLVRTPELKPEDNAQFETREVVLAEEGPAAKVVEISKPRGVAEEWFRDNYGGSTDNKQTHDTWESYVKDVYVADKLTAVSHTDTADLTKPFEFRVEAEKCQRGWTNDDKADVAIPTVYLYGRLPRYLRSLDEATRQDTKTQKPKKPRTADYVFTPFITEWQYHIIPPIGYRVRALPESKTEAMGPAKVSYAYATEPDGSVQATIEFDSVKGRYTPEESEAIRAAIRKFEDRSAIMITFDNIGHALMAAGKIPEGLKAYQEVAAKHPKEGLHRAQVAQGFLDAGLCETARKEARAATELDPKSAKAFSELGFVLEHDLVCRRFKGAFDYDGALAACRKAVELDPTDVYKRLDLMILMEHGKDGQQYSATSHLDDAIAEYKKVREIDKEVAQKWTANLLYDLVYAQHFDELQKELSSLPMDATHRAMSLVATAESKGSQAALQQSLQLTQDESTRSTALLDAARILLRMRKYPEAADLLAEAAKGQQNSAAVLQQADLFRKTKPVDSSPYPDSDVRSLVYNNALLSFAGGREGDLADMTSQVSWQGRTRQEMIEKFKTDPEMGPAKAQLAKSGLPLVVVSDLMFSTMQMAVAGDDVAGYRIVLQMMGANNEPVFAVKENGKYYLLDDHTAKYDLGVLALDNLKKNNLEAARKELDWARERIEIASGDDPLAGSAFPHLWTRGDPADPVKMRNAALGLASSRKDAKQWIPDIIAARDAAKNDNDRLYLQDALSQAYFSTDDWKNARESVLSELKAAPRSNAALGSLGVACEQLHDWETWSKAIETRLAAVPDDPVVLRDKASLLQAQSKFADALAIEKKLIDTGVGTPLDRNQYAWIALAMHNVTPEAIEQARQAVMLRKVYDYVHTLASLYAENGNAREAQQLAVELMDDNGLDEPDSSLWFVFGRIAEDYQQPKTAEACYKRVEWKQKFAPDPLATYVLAQERLKGLGNAGAVEAK